MSKIKMLKEGQPMIIVSNPFMAKTLAKLGYKEINNDPQPVSQAQTPDFSPTEQITHTQTIESLREYAAKLGLKPHWNASAATIQKMITDYESLNGGGQDAGNFKVEVTD